jgi:hypothetical protein
MSRMSEKEPWIDTRLSQKEMDFLWGLISEENKVNFSNKLAGNISKSEQIKDKDNWFYETTLKKLTEKMFYDDWDNYRKYHLIKEQPLPEFEMNNFWVNYMKQHEFNPIHNHDGLYSFVIFMKIPTHWKEQHALPISANSNSPNASDFAFVRSEKDREDCITIHFRLSSEDGGRMLFFPAWLSHLVYPFYGTEEERITISGNIRMYDPNRPEKQEIPVDEYEGKKNILKMLENSVSVTKKELKMMKKEREKEGLN